MEGKNKMALLKPFGHEGNKKVTADVVVVGAGPAGSVVAKNCARYGMHTVLLEKKKLPRHKMCTGLIISNLAHTLIAKEFGTIPETVLTEPHNLSGFWFHGWHKSNFMEKKREHPKIINCWRKELDYWMNQKAKEAGVDIWEETITTDIIQESNGIYLKVRRMGDPYEVRGRFVVGADGSASIIRKRLFPDLNIQYFGIYVESHAGTLNIDKRYWHVFGHAPGTIPIDDWFDVIHKGDCFLIEVSGQLTPPRKILSLAKQTLAENFGFEIDSEPLWTAGCVGPVLHEELISGRFLPAKENVLLVGDAAGLTTAGGEGINMALKSGLLASTAIKKAADHSRPAAPIYLTGLQPVIDVAKAISNNMEQRHKLLDQLIE